MTLEESKLEVLRSVEQGTLSVEEGAHLLEILDNGEPSQVQQPVFPPASVPTVDNREKPNFPQEVPLFWKAIWSLILWLGIAGLGLSGYWLFSCYRWSGMGVGFWFALIFILVSCVIVWIGVEFVIGRWMVIRVRSEDIPLKGDSFSIWIPVPIHLARWFFETFGKYMPDHVQAMHIVSVLSEVEQSLSKEEPFTIDVDSNEGSKTQINIEIP